MKKITLLMTALLISVCAHAQFFMGLEIAGTTTEFTNQLKLKGFELSPESKPAVMVMTGKLGSQNVRLLIAGTPKTYMTAKLVVIYPEEETWYSLLEDYNKVKKIITEKYGKPDKGYEFFESPYYLGDGYELQAVRSEKCFYIQVWHATEQFPNQTLAVRINKGLYVSLVYENDEIMALKEKEQKQIDDSTY
ncbi:hypothetical protein EBU94_02790 [bacterium]|nr:hypothetical protein [bacterium]